MSQYKKHPIDIALEGLSPILAPSFTLSSVRDIPEKNKKYPLIEYVIVGSQNINFDQTRQQWRNQSYVVLDFLLKESSPLDWCKYEELEQAKDLHSLQWHLEKLIQHFITLLVNPKSVYKSLNPSDMIWGEYDFKLENFIGSQGLYKHSEHKLTGVSVQFVLSYWSNDNCCIIDCANINQLKRLKDVTKTNSVSWKLLANETGCPIPTRCELILQGLTINDKLTCILPTYDFANIATQNALSVQQILDLKTWLLPQYDFGDSFWQNILTMQQEIDLTFYLLPDVDFSDVLIQAIITPQQQSDLINWLLPLVDFTNPTIQALITPQQQTDLQNWLCTPCPTPQQYSMLFDGFDERIIAQYNAAQEIERTDKASFSFWIKRTVAKVGGIVGKFTIVGTRRGWRNNILNTGELIFSLVSDQTGGNQLVMQSNSQVPMNTWTFCTITYSGNSLATGVNFYINGSLVGKTTLTNALSATTIAPTAILEFGVDSNVNFYAGYMHDVRAWKGVELTALEVADLYANNTDLYPSSLITRNKMGESSLFYPTSYLIPDHSGYTTSYATQNMEQADKTLDLPPI